MPSSYVRMEDFELNPLSQNLNDRVSPSNPNVRGKTDDTQVCGFKKYSVVLFCKTFVRCLITAIFVAFLLATLKLYENKGYFTSRQKINFNVIITVLSLCLGLNFFDSFKDLANVLRWKIHARYLNYTREHLVLEDLILSIESLVNVVRLGLKSRAIPWLCIFCITWVTLNLLAQVSVALINLTYSLNDGTDWRGIYTTNGIVNASDLTCYRHYLDRCPEEHVQQGLAHAYGESPSVHKNGSYDQIEELYKSSDSLGYYCRNTLGECAYRFVDYNPEDRLKAYPYLTNRVITASAGQCSTYHEIEKPTPKADALEYNISNGSVNDSITIPKQLEGDGTTYIYRGYHPPGGAEKFACGDRCIKMWAHQYDSHEQPSTFYECPISISNVTNIEVGQNEAQDVPHDVARLAAAAIGLQGRPAKEPYAQYQFYPFGNEWELHYHNATTAGANMAEFAIRSLSSMAYINPPRQASGLVPHLGTTLEVYWKYALALCGCIVVAQVALSVSVYVWDVGPITRDTVVR